MNNLLIIITSVFGGVTLWFILVMIVLRLFNIKTIFIFKELLSDKDKTTKFEKKNVDEK